MSDLSPLESRLAAFRRGLRLRFLWGALARLLTVAVLAIALIVALDWMVRAERPVRAVFALMAAATIAVAARRALKPLSLGMSDEDLVLAVEARHPELQDRLISALQLSSPKAAHAFNSPTLVERALAEALEACERVDFGHAVAMPRQRRWTATALVAGACFCALALLSSTFRVGLARLVMDRPWPSIYSLEVSLPGTKVAQGEDLSVTAALMQGSHRPRRVVLHVAAGPDETELTMAESKERAYLGTLEHLTKNVTLWVTAGDFTSRRYDIQVLEKPVVKAFQIHLTPPEYTGLPATDLPAGTGHLRALRGSRVSLTGTSSKPLKSCALQFSKKAVPLALAEPSRFSGDFLVEESDSYVISLEDAEGLKANHPVSYQLTVIKDQEPFVRILKPGKDMGVLAVAKIPLSVDVQDDYGLKDGTLVTVANRGTAQEQESRMPLFEPPVTKNTHALKAALTWDLGPLKLEPGRQLRYRAEARDLDTVSGPNLGRSQEYGLTILSPEEFQANLQHLIEEIVSDLNHAKEDARQARLGMEAAAPVPGDPSREVSAATLNLSLGRLSQSLQQVQDAIGGVQEIIAMNGISDPRGDEMLQGARDSVGTLVQQRLPVVVEDVKAGGKGEAAAWPRAVQGQEGVVQEIDRIANAIRGAADLGELLKRLERIIEMNRHITDRVARSGGAAPAPTGGKP